MIGTDPPPSPEIEPTPTPAWCLAAVVASAALGLALIVQQAYDSSATYDEVTYLRLASHWWRTGDSSELGRLGTPTTFFKLQEAPAFLALDLLGKRAWVDDPIGNQAKLLPVVRVGGAWLWLVALILVATWARRLQGPRAMAAASAIFALEPNLLAHGSLATMETPVMACSAAIFFGFWSFLRSGSSPGFWLAAVAGGVGFSCKFTTILIPPILALTWVIELARRRASPLAILRAVGPGMLGFGAAMLAVDLAITGFVALPLSTRVGDAHPLLEQWLAPGLAGWAGWAVERPYPQDWVGFATQIRFQGQGGPSYLLGERRLSGWRHYYPVALAVKVPLAFWFLAAVRARARIGIGRESGRDLRSWFLPAVALAFLAIAMLGSKRNYGVRYLLPVFPPAVVWVAGLAEGRRWMKVALGLGIAGMAATVAWIHPHELSYFNGIAGGSIGGRHVLADSNLDWGQGARSLARLQRDRPEFRDLTFFYFGDTDPAYYGVVGRREVLNAQGVEAEDLAFAPIETEFVAVSGSLQHGPWELGGYFRRFDRVEPVAYTADTTIAIYRASQVTR